MTRSVTHTRYLSGIFMLFFSIGNALGQTEVSITTGIGLPELMCGGVRFHLKQTAVEITVGSFPVSNGGLSVTGNVCYHFGQPSRYSGIGRWYGKCGLAYLTSKSERVNEKFMYLNTQMGREINISKRFGIDIDAGAAFELYHKKVVLSGGWGVLDFNFPVIPSLGICLYYRI